MTHFRNRIAAGRLLAARLSNYAGDPGVLVLGLARGGVPVAAEIARHLNVPLDVLVVRKLGVPCQEELALGAIAPGGVCVLNDELIDRLDVEGDTIGAVRLQEEKLLEERDALYRAGRAPLAVEGRTVIVVDDGIATGATMHAAVLYLHQHGAARVIVAAPIVSDTAFDELRAVATDVVALVVPDTLTSVGEWYEDFAPTKDEDVCALLANAETVAKT